MQGSQKKNSQRKRNLSLISAAPSAFNAVAAAGTPDKRQTEESSVAPRMLLFSNASPQQEAATSQRKSSGLRRRHSISSYSNAANDLSSINSKSRSRLFEDPTLLGTNMSSSTLSSVLPSQNSRLDMATVGASTSRSGSQLLHSTTTIASPEHQGRDQSTMNAISNATRQSSLFGAVMNKVQNGQKQQQQQGENNNNHDPPGSARGTISTPKASAPASSSLFSPGGFQLLDFVNSVASPFHVAANRKAKSCPTTENTPLVSTPAKAARLSFTCSPRTPATASSSSPASTCTPRHEIEWHEATVTKQMAAVLDWTLKSSLTFHCTPAILQDLLSLEQQQQLVTNSFVASNQQYNGRKTLPEQDNTAVQDWYKALQYWQYPADHSPLLSATIQPPSLRTPLMQKSKNLHNIPSSRLPELESSQEENHASQWWLETSIMPPPPVESTKSSTALLSRPGFQKNTAVSLSERRLREQYWSRRRLEWQQAFDSLFRQWMHQIKLLQEHKKKVPGTTATNKQQSLPVEAADIYFYCRGQDYTLLFQVGQEQGNSSKAHVCAPQILLSSTSRSCRNKLRALGIKLYLLEPWDGLEGEFTAEQEVRRGSGMHKSSSCPDIMCSSPSVKEELVALRRAQVFGQTVGADVSVSLTSTAGTTMGRQRPPHTAPPLYIIGQEHCNLFSEYYLNCVGELNASCSKTVQGDVPLLLCRSLGPFLHASCKRLFCLAEKQQPTLENDSYTTVRVNGTILPCACRSLVGAAVQSMRHHYTETSGSESSDSNSCQQQQAEEAASSSHHLLVECETESLETTSIQPSDATSQRTVMMGLVGSLRFNDNSQQRRYCNDSLRMETCFYGERFSVGVWDSSRPDSLAFKVKR